MENWVVFCNFSVKAVVVLLVLPEPVVKNPLGPQVKGSLVPQSLVVSDPQVTAQSFKFDLAKLGIIANVKESNDGLVIEVADLSTNNPDNLFVLLQKYELKLPSPDESSLIVQIVENDG